MSRRGGRPRIGGGGRAAARRSRSRRAPASPMRTGAPARPSRPPARVRRRRRRLAVRRADARRRAPPPSGGVVGRPVAARSTSRATVDGAARRARTPRRPASIAADRRRLGVGCRRRSRWRSRSPAIRRATTSRSRASSGSGPGVFDDDVLRRLARHLRRRRPASRPAASRPRARAEIGGRDGLHRRRAPAARRPTTSHLRRRRPRVDHRRRRAAASASCVVAGLRRVGSAPCHGRPAPRPRAARPGADLPRLGAGSRPPDAHEQPRPGGRRGPGPPRRLRRDRARGAELGRVRRDRPRAARASPTTRRSSSSRASRSASSGPTSGRRGSSSPTRTSSASGRPGSTSASSSGRGLMMYGQMTAGLVDLHRDPGHPAGHVRDVRRGWPASTSAGRCAAASSLTAGLGGMGGAQPLAVTMNDGVCLVDRGRRGAGPAAARHRLRRPADPRPGRGARLGARGGRRRRGRVASRWSATPPRSSRPGPRPASGSTS